LTSQAAGAWLTYILRMGRPLLSGETIEKQGLGNRDAFAPSL
jgi:hypothetical protein